MDCDARLDFAAEYYVFPVADLPAAMVVGDWNEDGRPDVATANTSSTLSILLAVGPFRLGSPVIIPVAGRPNDLVSADMDGDGHADLIVTGDFGTSVYRGDGHGGFALAVTFAAAGLHVAVADFDGDGARDIMIGSQGRIDILFLRGLALQSTSTLPYGQGQLAVGDFNEDRHPDVVVLDQNSLVALLNDGGGHFRSAKIYSPYIGIWLDPPFAGDLNGDGHLDIACMVYDSYPLRLLGRGDGTFAISLAPAGDAAPERRPAVRPSGTALGAGIARRQLAPAGRAGAGVWPPDPSRSVPGAAPSNVQGPAHVQSPSWLAAVADLNGDGRAELITLSDNRGYEVMDLRSAGPPTAVAIGDMNGDGRPDLVVGEAPAAIVIHPGPLHVNPTVSFPNWEDYPYECKVVDVNQDGIDDLWVGTSEDGFIILGAPHGGFGAMVGLWRQLFPPALGFGDLDGDGKPDLLSDEGTLFLGNGDGTFRSPPDDNLTGATPRSVAVGDLNGDGRLDLATADAGSGAVSVLLGRGGGNFLPATQFEAGAGASSVAIADLNGDGRADLAVANADASTVSVLLGNGDGTFRPRTDFGTGSSPSSVAIGDLNGDGQPDLAVTNADAATVSVLLGNGDGTFRPRTAFETGDSPSFVAIGDLDRDGRPDLVVANANAGSVSVLPGKGDGTFGARTDFPTGKHPSSIAIGDFNGDGRPDLAVSNSDYTANSVSVLLGDGKGGFGSRADFPTGHLPYSVAVGDLNGDGRLDLATANYSWGSSVLIGNGDGTFQPKVDFSLDGYAWSVAIGDLDGDGRLDLALSNGNADVPGRVSVLLGKGDGTFRPHRGRQDFFGESVAALSVGDINEDGRADLVLVPGSRSYDDTPAAGPVLVLLGDGDGYLRTPIPLDLRARWVDLVDLDGDGHLDLVTVGDKGGMVAYGAGDGTFPARVALPSDRRLSLPAFADLNADGRTDVLSAELTPSWWRAIGVSFLNRGRAFERVSAGFQGYLAGPSMSWPVVADLNGDGRPDVIPTGGAGIYLGNGDGTFHLYSDRQFGPGGDPTVVGDWNGDGRPDLVTFQQNDEDGYSLTGTLVLNRTLPNRPPVTAAARAAVALAWPPTHDLVDVAITGVSDPDGDPVTLKVTNVTQDESPGEGGHCPDATVADGRARIRLERAGAGNGRVYGLTFVATDPCGATAGGKVSVCIPHDPGRECVDDGQRYNALRCGAEAAASRADPMRPLGAEVAGGRVVIRYSLESDAELRLEIFDLAGRRLARLESGRRNAGTHREEWSGAPANGVYFARLTVNGLTRVERFVLLR